MKDRPWIVLAGGFLGAGKTTLLLAAAKELEQRGLRSALVLNDQGDALVDSEYAALQGMRYGEVTGGCFCCRFSDLIEVMGRLRAHSPDVIFAEPVGSCTDISATTLHPLLEHDELYRVAPYTVLVDPQRAKALLRSDAEAHLAFLFRKQIEEADLICFGKSDLRIDVPHLPGRPVRAVSGRTGQGVAAWLDEVLSGRLSAGKEILDIDYEQYAQAEAALAWMNLQVTVVPRAPASPALVLGPFFDDLSVALTAAGITIVHLKALIRADTGYIKAAICGNNQEPQLEGMLDASPALRHDLLVNLRASGAAARVRDIVEKSLSATNAQQLDLRISCFHPSPPTPQQRKSRAETYR